MRLCLSFVFLIQFVAIIADATDRYVVPPGTIENGKDAIPYNTWTNAATNIQWAVNVAAASETIWVSNGTYYLTNQITITSGTNSLTVRSVNGRDVTTINGNYPACTNRCFYVTNANALVQGFTITNGFVWGSGGGVYLRNGATVRNCIISGNTARDGSGGGAYIDSKGTVDLCSVVGNISTGKALGGGGVYFSSGGTATNSTIAWNLAVITNASGYYAGGGGAFLFTGGLVQNCTIASNDAQIVSGSGGWGGGGGAFVIDPCLILNSIVSGNTNNSRAGGVFMNGGATLRNCLIVNNRGGNTQAGGVTYYGSGTVQNCTIAGNTGSSGGLYIYGWYQYFSLIENCIIVSNYTVAGNLSNWEFGNERTNIYVKNTCTYPTNFTAGVTNIACISNNPAFVDYPAGNYRLIKDSPCVNTGTNQDWMVPPGNGTVDLDGRMRIRYGTVDMGAYEAIHNATFYRFH